MTVNWMWSGAVTASGAVVATQVDGGSARVLVADNPAMSGGVFFNAVATHAPTQMFKATITGLTADTQYWYQVEDAGVLDTSVTGRFHTHGPVGSPYSFTFAGASCAGAGPLYAAELGMAPNRLSNHPVWDSIRERDPLFLAHMGDMAYYDPGSGVHVPDSSLATYRQMYSDVHAVPRQAVLYRNAPIVYMFDDHDYGPNDSNTTAPGKANCHQVYRERVPHYPTALGSGSPYHAFQIGRVQFLVTDQRSFKSPQTDPDGPSKTMLGSAQKTWMESVLTASTAKLLVWIMGGQWIGSTHPDTWGNYNTERLEIAAMLGDTDWANRMMMVSGDVHEMGIDTGSHPYGGFPVWFFSSIDSPGNGTGKRGLDTGDNRPGRGQYGTVTVDDRGNYIRVTGSGWWWSS